ncbi:hypothetical protein ACLOJK_037763 [Asimina triloba]
MVNVYDNISPEKAQAIMFLAGSRSSMASVSIHPRAALMQAVTPKLKVADGIHGSQSRVASPCSGISSQISVGSRPSATLVPSVVPQARIASLARFLEKRKERVVNNGPYSLPTSSTENACGSNISNFVNKPQTSPVTQSSSNDQQFCRALHENDTMNLQAKSEMLMKERRVQTVDHHSPAEQGQKQRTREIEVIHQHHPTSEAAGGGVVAGTAEAMANTIQSVIDALTGTSSSEERKNERTNDILIVTELHWEGNTVTDITMNFEF